VDNALDAAEEAEIAPVINIDVDKAGITITDNALASCRRPSTTFWTTPSACRAERPT
jgi:hypothetical protein